MEYVRPLTSYILRATVNELFRDLARVYVVLDTRRRLNVLLSLRRANTFFFFKLRINHVANNVPVIPT